MPPTWNVTDTATGETTRVGGDQALLTLAAAVYGIDIERPAVAAATAVAERPVAEPLERRELIAA